MAVLRGHGLIAEGAPFERHVVGGTFVGARRLNPTGIGGEGRALCSCGETSPVLPSAGARRRWHKDHKNDVFTRTTLEGMSL